MGFRGVLESSRWLLEVSGAFPGDFKGVIEGFKRVSMGFQRCPNSFRNVLDQWSP